MFGLEAQAPSGSIILLSWRPEMASHGEHPPTEAESVSRKRKREGSGSSTESDTSLKPHEIDDRVRDAQRRAHAYGPRWEYFSRGFERFDRQQAYGLVKMLASSTETSKYYIGVCKDPASRFFEPPSAHKHNFDCMFPLLLGKNMGEVERNFLKTLRTKNIELHKLENKSTGGEGVHPRSLRFLYICVKRRREAAAASRREAPASVGTAAAASSDA